MKFLSREEIFNLNPDELLSYVEELGKEYLKATTHFQVKILMSFVDVRQGQKKILQKMSAVNNAILKTINEEEGLVQ